ncbi:hypothetical protein [Oleiagrimonas soli]|uniref:Uncharacterized protein n=1 Tax=Oleiagrimonas soli TaxID=1543381 RepID=A0A099CU58_9GAMM|nr:hypothetical protein [Oleiagrimonas soli]KGI77488.1 hypothetical protein LF63_0109080 [Oleiagrimonas soli]MBB6183053.1 hypothetical protein [Oleiagrimonas soli]
MKTKLMVLAVAFLLPAAAVAENGSPLHGIWKVDPGSIRATHPHAFEIRDGIYACLSCRPQYRIPADGAFYPVPTASGGDEVAVIVVNTGKVQITERRNGIEMASTVRELTGDAGLTRVTRTDLSGEKPVVSTFHHRRDGLPSDATHATSGSWKDATYTELSDSGRTFTYHVSGNRLQMTDPRGHAFVASMDGRETPYAGSHLISTVSVQKLAPHRMRMTTRHDGRVVGVTTVHVMPNGEWMRVVQEQADGSHMVYLATRLRSTALRSAQVPLGGEVPQDCALHGCALEH